MREAGFDYHLLDSVGCMVEQVDDSRVTETGSGLHLLVSVDCVVEQVDARVDVLQLPQLH